MEDVINEEYYVHTDYHTRAVTAFLFVTRWFGIRLGRLKNTILPKSIIK
jgi:hypothetical protein